MPPILIIVFMIFLLPVFIIKEAIALFTGHVPKKQLWSHILWGLIIVLSIIALILLLKGHQ